MLNLCHVSVEFVNTSGFLCPMLNLCYVSAEIMVKLKKYRWCPGGVSETSSIMHCYIQGLVLWGPLTCDSHSWRRDTAWATPHTWCWQTYCVLNKWVKLTNCGYCYFFKIISMSIAWNHIFHSSLVPPSFKISQFWRHNQNEACDFRVKHDASKLYHLNSEHSILTNENLQRIDSICGLMDRASAKRGEGHGFIPGCIIPKGVKRWFLYPASCSALQGLVGSGSQYTVWVGSLC